jgi:TIR domain
MLEVRSKNMTADAQLFSFADAGANQSRSLPRRIFDFVFGYDFFISYSWSDGAAYATGLATQLQAYGFKVFLDRTDYASGDDWKTDGAWTLRRTSQLILVGTPAATRSDPVIHEVEIFSKTRRRIVPIDFGGSSRAICAFRNDKDSGTDRRLEFGSLERDGRNDSPHL